MNSKTLVTVTQNDKTMNSGFGVKLFLESMDN